jgi:hypothetical protein
MMAKLTAGLLACVVSSTWASAIANELIRQTLTTE